MDQFLYDNLNLWEVNKVSALKGLKILVWNLRSLHPKIDIVREFVKDIGGLDLFCVNETWLKPVIPNGMVKIDGFTIVRNDRTVKRGGGTCIYVNNRLSYQENSQVLYNSKDLEMQGITLKGNGLYAQKPIDVFAVYRPPGGDNNSALNTIIEKVQMVTEGSNNEVIILGDLNWDCLAGNESKQGK